MAVTFDKHGLADGFALQKERESAEEWAKLENEQQVDESKKNEKARSEEDTSGWNVFKALQKRVFDNLIAYYSLITFNSFSAALFSKAFVQTEMLGPITKGGAPLSGGAEWKIYGLSEHQVRHVAKSSEKLKQVEVGMAAMPISTLLSLVATVDSLIADVAKIMIREKPEKLETSAKAIPISMILSAGSKEEIVEKFVSDEVYTLLRDGHDQQIAYIEKNFDINIRDSWSRWPDFIEIFERRNLLAHGERSYTSRYRNLCGRHGECKNAGEVGTEIKIPKKYLNHCVDILLEFFILITFSLWRKNFKSDEAEAFSNLNEIAYSLIQEGRCRVAERILEFGIGIKSKNFTDSTKKRMIVNRANALKKTSKNSDCEKLLNEVDWSSSSEEYKICVAALREDIGEVISLMRLVKKTGSISMQGFREWPVFDGIREREEFQKEFKKLWKEPLLIKVETHPAHLVKTTDSSSVSDDGEAIATEQTKH